MCEERNQDDLQERIDGLIASGKHNGQVLSALESQGYEVIHDPIFGVGIRYTNHLESVIYYHPNLGMS